MTTVRPGRYRHYKDKYYQVIGCATHTETGDELVIYRALYGEYQLWARPKAMFLESITLAGKSVPRFHYVENEDAPSSGDGGESGETDAAASS